MTYEIACMLGLLGITALLFITEWVRLDVAGLLVLISLGWLGFVPADVLFGGFASQAVIAMMGVMIIGRGLDRAGITGLLVEPILRFSGGKEHRLRTSVSGIIGAMSAFLQNIGAMALFLPSVLRASKRTKISPSRLLMPIGFAAIMGGTLTMVGSSSLIVLNDMLRIEGLEPFGLFDVTPLGLSLLGMGILFFLLFGGMVLPDRGMDDRTQRIQQTLISAWKLPERIHFVRVPANSSAVGENRRTLRFWDEYSLNLLGIGKKGDVMYAPDQSVEFDPGEVLILLGSDTNIERLISEYGLEEYEQSRYERMFDEDEVGFAEMIVPPRSELVGTAVDADGYREQFGVEPIVLLTRDGREKGHFVDNNVQPGDTFVVHGLWNRIEAMISSGQFVSADTIESPERGEPRQILGGLCFLLTLVLALVGPSLSLAMFSGALAMVMTGVLPIEDAYEAIDWRTVFLLATLIPLGIAMDQTGTAEYLSSGLLGVVAGQHAMVVLLVLGLLTTVLALFMSNVAATILLVPLVLELGTQLPVETRGLILLVGVCATNSFILPTHQVNALIKSPGQYQTIDFIRAGTGMSVLYLLVSVGYIYLVY
jgi:di/tricarboxylate transporter